MTVLSAETRVRLRSDTRQVLEELRAHFPLERHVTNATADERAGYRAILRHWVTEVRPPARDDVDKAILDALLQLDAVVASPNGLGCYPFSAASSGITATSATATIDAMCGLDIFAIPRLIGQAVTVRIRCGSCDARHQFELQQNGSLPHAPVDRLSLVIPPMVKSPEVGRTCADTFCAHARFICATCEIAPTEQRLTMAQAAVIGNAFFAFHHRLFATAEF